MTCCQPTSVILVLVLLSTLSVKMLICADRILLLAELVTSLSKVTTQSCFVPFNQLLCKATCPFMPQLFSFFKKTWSDTFQEFWVVLTSVTVCLETPRFGIQLFISRNHVIFSTISLLFRCSVVLFIITSTSLLGANIRFPDLKFIGCHMQRFFKNWQYICHTLILIYHCVYK